ncbi:cytochrome P450 4g15-like [Polistes fuscatus]|uniref:cytochrome P450 4g15-like n=1 Tax=Polistes fuscatus TaxID=30207 RepID=UPI001CA916D1|nr:cytochrome P450 4g15-like [Polistes fuscatus]
MRMKTPYVSMKELSFVQFNMENITTVLALTAIIIILFYVIEYLINKFREYNMVKKYQGPKAYPLIGNLNLFVGDLKDITYKLIKLSENYSSPWRLWVGPKLVLFFDDPEYMKIISDGSYGWEKSELYDFMKPYIGNGLFTAPASVWKIHRRILNPVFKEQMFSTYMDSIVRKSNTLANILETTNGENVNFLLYVNMCTLDIIYGSLLESDFDLQNNSECRFQEYLIEKKKETIEEGKVLRESNGLDESTNERSFLDLLFISLYEKGEISEQDIRDEINTIVLTGSETSAATLSFLFLMLATFPDVQNQIYEELYDLYGSSDPDDVPITLEDIKKMKYLERVVKETLRLFPSAPFIGRTSCRDIKVDENLVIPKNCSVVFGIFSLHRKDKYWTDPLRFNPDRFLPGNYNLNCFLPFSTGKRNCIGQKFVMIQMKAITATLLRKFIVRIDNPVSVENVKLKFSITLKPGEPIFLRFNKR